jgi:hypothetical protein
MPTCQVGSRDLKASSHEISRAQPSRVTIQRAACMQLPTSVHLLTIFLRTFRAISTALTTTGCLQPCTYT